MRQGSDDQDMQDSSGGIRGSHNNNFDGDNGSEEEEDEDSENAYYT